MASHLVRRALKARTIVFLCVVLGLSSVIVGITSARLGLITSSTKSINQIDAVVNDSRLINIYATISGFEPQQVTVRAGENIIMIRNRTGRGSQSYSLISAETEKANELPVSIGNARLGERVRMKLPLTPGEYLLREAKRSDRFCRIKVVP
ncbi:MAG: hypothetical protein AB1489_24040 [Acidobacteriota bacterium]